MDQPTLGGGAHLILFFVVVLPVSYQLGEGGPWFLYAIAAHIVIVGVIAAVMAWAESNEQPSASDLARISRIQFEQRNCPHDKVEWRSERNQSFDPDAYGTEYLYRVCERCGNRFD